MKKCSQCNHECKDEAKFCTKCGAASFLSDLPESRKESLEKKEVKKPKKKTKLILIIAILAIGALVFGLLYIERIKKGEEIVGNSGLSNNKIEEKLDQVNELIGKKEFVLALETLKTIPKEYEKYTKVEKANADIKRKMLEETKSNIDSLLQDKKYSEAISQVIEQETYLGKVNNNEKLKEIMVSVVTSYKTDCYAEVDLLSKSGKQEEAVVKLATLYSDVGKLDQELALKEPISDRFNQVKAEYIQMTLHSVDELLKKKSFSEALILIENAEKLIGKENELQKKKSEAETGEVLHQLASFINEKKYEEGINFAKQISPSLNDTKIAEEQEKLYSLYRESVYEEAKKTFEESGYAEGVKVLTAALQKLPGDSKLKAKIEEFKEFKPVYLVELDPFFAQISTNTETIKDSEGKSYGNSFAFYSGSNTEKSTYLLAGKYKRIEGLYSVDYGNRSVSTTLETQIIIYGDNKELYSATTAPGVRPQEISVDITGVDELTILFRGINSYKNYNVFFGEVKLYP